MAILFSDASTAIEIAEHRDWLDQYPFLQWKDCSIVERRDLIAPQLVFRCPICSARTPSWPAARPDTRTRSLDMGFLHAGVAAHAYSPARYGCARPRARARPRPKGVLSDRRPPRPVATSLGHAPVTTRLCLVTINDRDFTRWICCLDKDRRKTKRAPAAS